MNLMIFDKYRGYFVVLGGFLIQLSIGNFFASENIQFVIVDYMKNYSYSNASVNMGNSGWIFGAIVLGMGAAMSLGGYIEIKIGPSLTVLISGWLMSLNVCLMYVTLNTYLSVVIISYGLISGFGTGIAYGVALGTPMKWFPNRKGLIFGIVVSGYAMSGIIFDVLQDEIINVNRYIYLDRLPLSFVILGLNYAALQFIGSILLKNKPDDELEETQFNSNVIHSNQNKITILQEEKVPNNQTEFEPHQLIYVFEFWILWLIMFLNSACFTLTTSLYNRYWKVLDLKDNGRLKILSFIVTAFSCIGRIFWGYLIDKIPFKIVMLILILTSSIFIGTLPIMPLIPEPFIVYGVWMAIISFFISGNYSIFPMMCAKLFGMKNFVSNYGMLFTSCSVAGTIVSLVLMYVLPDDSNSKNIYRNTFIIGGIIAFLAALLTLLFKDNSLTVYHYFK